MDNPVRIGYPFTGLRMICRSRDCRLRMTDDPQIGILAFRTLKRMDDTRTINLRLRSGQPSLIKDSQ